MGIVNEDVYIKIKERLEKYREYLLENNFLVDIDI
jgi:hypothetical protein